MDARAIAPDAVATSAGDAVTVEALVEEPANPDENGVIYAIDMLEAKNRTSSRRFCCVRSLRGRADTGS